MTCLSNHIAVTLSTKSDQVGGRVWDPTSKVEESIPMFPFFSIVFWLYNITHIQPFCSTLSSEKPRAGRRWKPWRCRVPPFSIPRSSWSLHSLSSATASTPPNGTEPTLNSSPFFLGLSFLAFSSPPKTPASRGHKCLGLFSTKFHYFRFIPIENQNWYYKWVKVFLFWVSICFLSLHYLCPSSFVIHFFLCLNCSKTAAKMAVARIKLLRNKRQVVVKQMRRDIALLLQSGQDATARIRVFIFITIYYYITLII